MSYTPTNWADEVPASTPVKYTVRDSVGNILYDDVTIDVKTSLTAGTQLNAANMNKLEEGVEDNADDITSILADMAGMLPDAFTVAGQIPYSSAAGVLALLAAGANGKRLGMESGAPAWVDSLQYYTASRGTFVSLTTSYADITDMSVSVTTKRDNAFVAMVAVGQANFSGGNVYARGVINSVADGDASLIVTTGDYFFILYWSTITTAGAFDVKLQAIRTAASSSGNVQLMKMLVLVI